MTASIIIAVKTWQKNLEECVDKCRQLDYSDFEILILPDSEIGIVPAITGTVPAKANISQPKGTVPKLVAVPELIIIPTGPVSPSQKRDMAIPHAKGEILAFIDDDAYPEKDWLKKAAKNFIDPEVAAVGGPAVTPADDSLRQKASGLVYSSLLVSGQYSYRYLPKPRKEVDDYPSCNFLVRKSIMQELGGFNTNFWPGEDTKLCLDITNKLKKKIVYDPKVLVYHHRRPLFLAHLKQITNYALHRGYFVKKYPQTSLRLAYFIPSIFVFGLFTGGIISLFLNSLRIFYLAVLSLYLFLVLISSISKELRLIPFVFLGIIFTHISYGTYFLKGLLSRRLAEEKTGTVPNRANH